MTKDELIATIADADVVDQYDAGEIEAEEMRDWCRAIIDVATDLGQNGQGETDGD